MTCVYLVLVFGVASLSAATGKQFKRPLFFAQPNGRRRTADGLLAIRRQEPAPTPHTKGRDDPLLWPVARRRSSGPVPASSGGNIESERAVSRKNVLARRLLTLFSRGVALVRFMRHKR